MKQVRKIFWVCFTACVRVAQWIERGISNPLVAGSSPAADILQPVHLPKGESGLAFSKRRN